MLDITADKNHEKDAYVISLSGLLDSETSRDFESFFSDMLNKGYRYYILEASRLTGMSSSGISELIKFLQNVYNAGGTVCFTGLNKEVRMLLEFSGIALKCPLFINIREAENYIQRTIAGSSSFVQGYDNTPHVSSMQKSEKSRDIFRDEEKIKYAGEEKTPANVDVPSGKTVKKNQAVPIKNNLSGMPVSTEDSILECEQCGTVMRIYKSGRHLCPSCGIEFFVKQDGAASYFEKLSQ